MIASITASSAKIWFIIVILGIGTYLIRFSFLGLIGGRDLPNWLLRLLRFTPVAVLPGIAVPMVVETGIDTVDPIKVVAAITTVIIGLTTRNALYAIIAGVALFFGARALWA